jgi:isopenicillin-N epimerase
LANVGLDSVDCVKLMDFFWTKHRIIVTPIKRDDYQGIRVTPNVYTTLEEVDTFAQILEDVARRGGI